MSVISEDYFHFAIGLVMATEVNYILGKRKYLRGNFSFTYYHVPFTNLIKIRRLTAVTNI